MHVPEEEKKTLLVDEVLYVRHAGEIPEVALHSSLYYLTEDPEGPGVRLQSSELALLKGAVIDRYTEIILRDLQPDNRDKGLYRGVARCIANCQRCLKFCEKEGFTTDSLIQEVSRALKLFLRQEIDDIESGRRVSCINCTQTEFETLLSLLNLPRSELPTDWLCLWQK